MGWVTITTVAHFAVVAINFAAIASDEARVTLLMDTNGAAATVVAAVRLRPGAGVVELARGSVGWHDVIRGAQLGRDRSIDVVPSGEGPGAVEDIARLLTHDISSLTRHYDAVVLVSSLEQVAAGLPAALPIPDVIYCARIGQTLIAELEHAVKRIARSGANARGVVLWNSPDPVLAELRPAADVIEATESAA